MLSELAIAYLFLGGTGAGCSFACSLQALALSKQPPSALRAQIGSFRSHPWKNLFPSALTASCGCLAIGAVCLCVDLGQPMRILMMLFPAKFTYLTFGAWSIVICMALSATLTYVWFSAKVVSKRAFALLGALDLGASSAVIIYTGLMLSSIGAVPLWDTAWLTVLFSLSSLSCGLGLLTLVSVVTGSSGAFHASLAVCARADTALILAEIATFVILGVSALGPLSGAEGADATYRGLIESWNTLLVGELAPGFWSVLVIMGMLAPLVLEAWILHGSKRTLIVRSANSPRILISLSACCVLLGGAALRYLIVMAGAHPPIAPFM